MLSPAEQQTEKAKARVGKRFDRLTVTEWLGSNRHRQARYACVCDCGGTVTRLGAQLNKPSVDCGCRGKTAMAAAHQTHGGCPRSGTQPEYLVWAAMCARCNNPNNKAYRYYGGKGVQVCERWSDYGNFIADMGPRPHSKMQIDRIDSSKDYCPENCRWLLGSENARRAQLGRRA